jgi:hypothetical protein
MSPVPPELVIAERALAELFAGPDVVVRHTAHPEDRITARGADPLTLMREIARGAHTVRLAVNELAVMVCPHDRYGLPISGWSDRPEFNGTSGMVQVRYPSSPVTRDLPGWKASMRRHLQPVIEQALAAVAADRHDDDPNPTDAGAARWWVSWYAAGPFTYHGPWWISGGEVGGEQRATVCAAVVAASADDARRRIVAAHDDPTVSPQWRFVERRDNDWSPFGDRFPRAAWMRWPDTEGETR